MSTHVNVPDIGDFDEVEIIEVLVEVGDTIKKEQSLITVESDKASMEIPSDGAGVITAIHVKVGDKVKQGSAILALAASAAPEGKASASTTAPTEAPSASAAAQKAAPTAPEGKASASTTAPTEAASVSAAVQGVAPSSQKIASTAPNDAFDVLVLGAGPGGYSAAFRAADLGLTVALIERYPTLGGVCLNVGCIPSKALLHTIAVLEEAKHLSANGIVFGDPKIDLDALRAHKDGVVAKLTGGLSAMAKMRKVSVITGHAQFKDDYHVSVQLAAGGEQEVAFKHAIIAAGSQSVKLPFLPEDERIIDSTGALALKHIPQKMLIIGGGIIGLEMGTVYSGLGTRLDVVEMMNGLMQGPDRDLVKVWQKKNAHRFDRMMINTKTVAAEAKKEGIYVSFEGEGAPKEPQRYDMVLQAVGRSPNGHRIAADKAGVMVNERGFIPVDTQMRTNIPHIFAIGDIVGQPMLAHKAVHEAHVAAEVIAGQKTGVDARVIPGVAFTDPEVAWAGLTEEQAKAQGIAIEKGIFPWAASGRAIANGRDEGFTKLIFDAETKRILGGSIVGTHAGDMISEICLAIEMGADASDIGKTIHPHPTLGESVGMAAEVAHGSCTDLPPQRKA